MNIVSKFTLKTLKKNRVRTIMTMIGVILSMSMITAVATLVVSFQSFMVDTVVSQTGDWHGRVDKLTEALTDKLESEEKIDKTFLLSEIGYAKLETKNKEKPYLYIQGVSSFDTDMLVLDPLGGRFPENENEILIPLHLSTNGGIKYSLGDTLTLGVGNRVLDGTKLMQASPICEQEIFEEAETKEYTIVGFYSRPSFEPYSAPGYTALTIDDVTSANASTIFLHFDKINKCVEYLKDVKGEYAEAKISFNSDYLRFSGASDNDNINVMLYSVGAILMIIIIVASISLIYNAFSISVNERSKNFGLLSSIGATRKQIRKSVYTEAGFLCAVCIPLGILAGIVGIGVTIKLLAPYMSQISGTVSAEFCLAVSPMSLVLSALLGIVTVFISAFIPASQISKMNTIEILRQSKDIKLSGKKVRASKLTQKLFGFEGMLASKNFKRNKRKYRATIFSLFTSIVLFVTASTFCTYLLDTVDDVYSTDNYDIEYTALNKLAGKEAASLYSAMQECEGITKSTYTEVNFFHVELPSNLLTEEFISAENGVLSPTVACSVSVCFVNDERFNEFAEQNGFNPQNFYNTQTPQSIAYSRYMANIDSKITYGEILNVTSGVITVSGKTIKEGYRLESALLENDEIVWRIVNPDDETDYTEYTTEEFTKSERDYTISFAGVAKNAMDCQVNENGIISLFYPLSMKNSVLQDTLSSSFDTFVFQSSNNILSENALSEVILEAGLDTGMLHNYASVVDANKSLATIFTVFAYGFIVLMSLIAVVNIFNTISTNISIRRREFAVLKSVGMTQKSMMRMMNYECALYGFKSILFSVPASIFISYLIQQAFDNAFKTTFKLPISSVLIAVGSVFAVILITMLYSMSKLKKENTIDTIKDENI